ncbi:helix-turn-helix transcriptional regulator [Kitasatospora aureofaciens]|uniref:helix-turn-helix domain-containing protein n=1 Tax=Kitasatospora aureofaciens TaxID=1894 RepID=UPI001C461CC9|nr:helix-turn-helix transcriptional regulator [Kitasatospora aureofaciens]MBV6702608.1 helix-turn-helix transcriptional regulator [Kitasatospora aureofaciens]
MGRSMTPPTLATPTGRFASELQSLKHRSGLTLAAISEKCHVSVPTLSKAFNGRELPSWETVRKVVEACGGDSRRWRRSYEDCIAVMRGPADEDWLMAEAIRSWTPARPWVPLTEPRTLDEYRLWLKVAKRFADRSFSELSRLSRLGQNSWAAESFASLVSGRRALNPRCVLSFLMACGIARYADLRRWLWLIPAGNDTWLRAEVMAASASLHASSIGSEEWEVQARAATAAGYDGALDRPEAIDSTLDSLVAQLVDQVRWPEVDAVVKTSRGLMLVQTKHHSPETAPQASVMSATKLVRRAGLDPVSPYPGRSTAPWACQCSNCGAMVSPSVAQILARGYTCALCGWEGRSNPPGFRMPGTPSPRSGL